MAIQVDPRTYKSLKTVRRQMRRHRRQVPFAMSQAINDTAFDVRHHIVNVVYPRSFEVRNRRFAGVAFRVDRSSKRKLVARVFDRLGRAFLPLQQSGGVKTPYSSTFLAVPVQAKRTATGKSNTQRLKNTFVHDFGKGPAIWQRRGRGGRRLKLLYVLERDVDVDAAFPFEREGRKVVDQVFPGHFAKRWRRALKTAR